MYKCLRPKIKLFIIEKINTLYKQSIYTIFILNDQESITSNTNQAIFNCFLIL